MVQMLSCSEDYPTSEGQSDVFQTHLTRASGLEDEVPFKQICASQNLPGSIPFRTLFSGVVACSTYAAG